MQINVAQPHFPPSEIESILKDIRGILMGESVLSMGPRVSEFEQSFARYVGARFAVAVNSCSAALEIALRSIEISHNDEVIVPVETFIATGSAVLREGGKVVFAGVDPDTFCLSASELERRLTSRTKTVILVHMAGMVTPDVFRIQELCRSCGVMLIEDAAHAPGASISGKKAGTFGDIACFSFFPTKVMTTAEGGMLVTNDENIYRRANSYRNRGRDLESAAECYISLGTNNRMNEIAAILGLSQLRCLDEFIEKRGKVARIYREILTPYASQYGVSPLPLPEEVRHSYWKFIVRIPDMVDRVRLRHYLHELGIAVDWAYEPPLHLQPLFRNLYGSHEGMLPETESVLRNFVCLPVHVGLSCEDAQFIGKSFLGAVEEQIG